MCWTSARHSHFSSLNFIFFPHAGTAFLQSMDALLIKWVMKHFVLCPLFTITPSSSVKAVIRSYFNWNWINDTLLFPSPTSPSLFWQFVMRASGYDLWGKRTFPRTHSLECVPKDALSRTPWAELWRCEARQQGNGGSCTESGGRGASSRLTQPAKPKRWRAAGFPPDWTVAQ